MPKEVSCPLIRMQLVSPGNVITLFQDVGGILVGPGAIGVSGRLVIAEIPAGLNFQAAVGIQPFTSDVEVASAPVQPSINNSGTSGLGMKQSVGKYFFSFDPTNASNGDIAKAFRFRLGVLYGSHTSNAISRGEVLFEYTVRYA